MSEVSKYVRLFVGQKKISVLLVIVPVSLGRVDQLLNAFPKYLLLNS